MRSVINLNPNWLFAKTAEIPNELNCEWESVNLPHSWNALDGQDGGGDYFRGTCCYAKTISKAEFARSPCEWRYQ